MTATKRKISNHCRPLLRLADGSEIVWYTPDYVLARLQDAGRTLMMLPATGCWPAGHKSNWPEVVRTLFEAYGRDAAERPRMRATMVQMDRLEDVMTWLPQMTTLHYRKVLAYRMLVHPDTGRHVYSWRRTGEKMKSHHETVKEWHDYAVKQLTDKLNMGL